MGDGDDRRDGSGVTLSWVPLQELRRLRGLPVPAQERAALVADACRLNVLSMVKHAGSGHLGTSFSSLDLMAWVLLEEKGADDLFFSSKGHDAPALYSLLVALEQLPFESLRTLRTLGGLPGHPDVRTPHVAANTGSLGMGISKAKGMVWAKRHLKRPGRVFVLMGDGELQEGQVWEALSSAARDRMGEITVIVDTNRIQSDTWVDDVLPAGDMGAKFAAFGWHVERCDGHGFASIATAFQRLRPVTDRPRVLIAETLKGKGVSFMEGPNLPPGEWRYRYHSGAPTDDEYERGSSEIQQRLLRNAGGMVAFEKTHQPAHRVVADLHRLVPAYSQALIRAAERDERVVVLDADLVLDCGLIPFRERFPNRFLECGIAEQDMVSQAGAMARQGLLPFVHSFGAFLSARPNEQIYNNATEGARVVYVATLSGILPGGPGHSHQSVREISALGAVPGLLLLAPCHAREVELAVEFAAAKAKTSVYLRIASVAWDVPYDLPREYELVPGQGVELRAGRDAVLLSYGPVLLSEAWNAAADLERRGISVSVVNLPWLNAVDPQWLSRTVAGRDWVFTLDDQYLHGGQGDMLLRTILEMPADTRPRAMRLGLSTIPACGKNDAVLRHHRLDAQSIAHDVEAFLRRRAAVVPRGA